MYEPSRETFRELAHQGNLIPVCRRLLADFETPLSAYSKIRGQGESFLLESVEGGEHLGRYSFVGCNPRAIIRQDRNQVVVRENGRLTKTFTVTPNPDPADPMSVRDGLQVVENLMARFRSVEVPDLPRFTGGALGFIGYEYVTRIEPSVPVPPTDELGLPMLYFMVSDSLLIFDRAKQTLRLCVNAHVRDDPAAAYANAGKELEELFALLRQPRT